MCMCGQLINSVGSTRFNVSEVVYTNCESITFGSHVFDVLLHIGTRVRMARLVVKSHVSHQFTLLPHQLALINS